MLSKSVHRQACSQCAILPQLSSQRLHPCIALCSKAAPTSAGWRSETQRLAYTPLNYPHESIFFNEFLNNPADVLKGFSNVWWRYIVGMRGRVSLRKKRKNWQMAVRRILVDPSCINHLSTAVVTVTRRLEAHAESGANVTSDIRPLLVVRRFD